MNKLEPINQPKLFGLDKQMLELVNLYKTDNYPNKILFSGRKGTGKLTLAYHFINYVLSQDEYHKYDIENFKIDTESSTFKTILNKSNPNFTIIDNNLNKKSVDINRIRELIIDLNKSSFNNKPRFVLIDNIEFLNKSSINALLKILEEPNQNINFILINNDKKVLPTLLSRCINYKINLSNKECLVITDQLLDNRLDNLINKDLIDYYFTPGNIYHLIEFANQHKYNLLDLNLKKFLKIIIKENHYKKDPFMKYMVFHLIEFYFRKLNLSFSEKIEEKYSYFMSRISDTKTFNLDEESLFMEFDEEILNG
jgi:DNA polymerase III subunit delta'